MPPRKARHAVEAALSGFLPFAGSYDGSTVQIMTVPEMLRKISKSPQIPLLAMIKAKHPVVTASSACRLRAVQQTIGKDDFITASG